MSRLYKACEDVEWKRFVKHFESNASFEQLNMVLSRMADYDRERLDFVIFNYACIRMEREGVNPSEDIRLLDSIMRKKFFEVGKKVYQIYRKRQEGISIKFCRKGEREIYRVLEEKSFEDKPIESARFHNNFKPIILNYS